MRLTRERPIDPEAQDLYLHGVLLREADDCKNAAEYFTRAIAKKPAYAQAHSALASCYGRMGESGRMPYEEAFTRQKAEAIKAIELDGSLSEAHAELANTAMSLDWDWPTARRNSAARCSSILIRQPAMKNTRSIWSEPVICKRPC